MPKAWRGARLRRVVRNSARLRRAGRFTRWQVCRLLAGGSRERLEVWQFYIALSPPHGTDAMGKTLRWVNPGSRLLPTHSAAMLRSGSPPGLGHATPCSLRGREWERNP
jgi:hypothetical protein